MCHMAAMAAMACRGVLPRGRWPQPPRYSERPAATGLPCRPRPSSPMPPDRRRKQHKTRHDDNDDDRCCAWRRTRANGWPRAIESSDSSAAVPLGFKMHSHFKTLHVLPTLHCSAEVGGRLRADMGVLGRAACTRQVALPIPPEQVTVEASSASSPAGV